MRSSLISLLGIVLLLPACVSSPLPMKGGQVQRDRECQWQHLELHLVLDPAHRHLLGTARLHIRSLDPATQTVALDLGSLRLAGAVKDSAGRELERVESRGSARVFQLAKPLARGEEEVLEVRFDGVSGPGLAFEQAGPTEWILLGDGGFFPHVRGRGHYPTMDMTIFADGEKTVVGPGLRLLTEASDVGPGPAHFRIAEATNPAGVNYLVGPLEPVELSRQDEGWCSEIDRAAAELWIQAWMQARGTDADPGAPCRVVFLPQELGVSGWQGGWQAIALGTPGTLDSARAQCRRWVIEQGLVQGMLPDSGPGGALLDALVQHAQASEDVALASQPDRMSRGLEAMERQLGSAPFENLVRDFLVTYRGQPMGPWEWARFAEQRSGFSAEALFESLTGR
jgi:hypothetical protein